MIFMYPKPRGTAPFGRDALHESMSVDMRTDMPVCCALFEKLSPR